MTIEQRLEQVELQNQKIQRTNKRLTVALTMTVVTMCALVTMAFSNEEVLRGDYAEFERGDFELLTAKTILIKDENDTNVMSLGKHPQLRDGQLMIYSSRGAEIVRISGSFYGLGTVRTFSEHTGKEVVAIHGSMSGGYIGMFNEAGIEVVKLESDTAGSGKVEVTNNYLEYDIKGRTLKPGP